MIYIAVLILMASGSMLDSESSLPIVVCVISMAYLFWWAVRRKLL